MFSTISIINDVFNITARAESEYNLGLNIIREKIIRKNFTIANTNGTFIVNKTINEIYDTNNEFLIKNIKAKGYLSDQFTTDLTNYLNGNLCNLSIFSNDNLHASCGTILQSVALNGLEIMIVRYFEYLRLAYQQYLISQTSQNIIDILNGELMEQITIFYHYFIRGTSSLITSEMKNDIDSLLLSELSFRMILFIIFLVFLVLGYLILWLPFQGKLSDEILRTKKMLEIIPRSILEKMDSLKEI